MTISIHFKCLSETLSESHTFLLISRKYFKMNKSRFYSITMFVLFKILWVNETDSIGIEMRWFVSCEFKMFWKNPTPKSYIQKNYAHADLHLSTLCLIQLTYFVRKHLGVVAIRFIFEVTGAVQVASAKLTTNRRWK